MKAAATSPRRMCLLTATLVVLVGTILSTFGPDVADAWPSPRYECYCRNCFAAEHFVCRNRDYVCNCAKCSCYTDVLTAAETPPRDKHGNDDDDDDTTSNNNNKWSINVDERPHRRLVTHRGGEWIHPTLSPSLGPHESSPKPHLDGISHFCRAHERDQQTQTDRQTDRPRNSVCRNRLLSLAIAAMRPNNNCSSGRPTGIVTRNAW